MIEDQLDMANIKAVIEEEQKHFGPVFIYEDLHIIHPPCSQEQ